MRHPGQAFETFVHLPFSIRSVGNIHVISMEFSAVNRRRPSQETPLGPERRSTAVFVRYLLSGPVPTTNQSARVKATILHVMTTHKKGEFDLKRFWNWNQSASSPPKPLMKLRPFCVTTRMLQSLYKTRATMPNYHRKKIFDHHRPTLTLLKEKPVECASPNS